MGFGSFLRRMLRFVRVEKILTLAIGILLVLHTCGRVLDGADSG